MRRTKTILTSAAVAFGLASGAAAQDTQLENIGISVGLLGEYVGRVFMAVNRTPQFVLKEIYDGGSNHENE